MTAVSPAEHAIDSLLYEGNSNVEEKIEQIEKACGQHDIKSLISLASSEGGLLSDELRRTAWPLLLGSSPSETEATPENLSWKELPPHQDEEQVQKDVDRAFVYYPAGETQLSLRNKKLQLLHLIQRVLRAHPTLHYFQGYHDIAQVLLLVQGEDAAVATLTRISLLRIRDYMLVSLDPATKHLFLIPAILARADPPLAARLAGITPFFALSAVLTLFAHDLTEYAPTARLFDFVLAHEPVMSIYLFVALVVSRRDELLDIPADEPDMLLFRLQKVPQQLDLQSLIDGCLEIFRAWPPEKLLGRAWARISSDSVLKTSRDVMRPQTLADAEAAFARQTSQLKRDALRKKAIRQLRKNQKPILLGATIVVALLSYYLRKTGSDRILWSTLWRIADALRRQS